MASYIPPPTQVDNVTLQQSGTGILSVKGSLTPAMMGAGVACVERGTYTGDGQPTQAVVLGFRPQAVFIGNSANASRNAMMVDSPNDNEAGLIFTPTPGGSAMVDITATGFTVGNANLNVNLQVYRFIAFRGAT